MIEDKEFWETMTKEELVETAMQLDKELDDALIEIACFKDELVELDNLREFKTNWGNRDGL